MVADSGVEITELRVDGGMTHNELLMQFQADILGVEVHRPKNVETTATGAAFAAGLQAGYFEDLKILDTGAGEFKVWKPQMEEGSALASTASGSAPSSAPSTGRIRTRMTPSSSRS